jgi:hypothetical protein
MRNIRKVFTEKKINDIVEKGMEKSSLDKATEEGMPEPEDDLKLEYDFSQGVRGKYINKIKDWINERNKGR